MMATLNGCYIASTDSRPGVSAGRAIATHDYFLVCVESGVIWTLTTMWGRVSQEEGCQCQQRPGDWQGGLVREIKTTLPCLLVVGGYH